MKDSILINGKSFSFERQSWRHEVGNVIDKSVAVECLSLVSSVFKAANINAFLLWGTLLGAIRDDDFISHDYDLDLGILWHDEEKLKSLIPKLYEMGFIICRYKNHSIYSFNYKGLDCDIDVFTKPCFPYSFRYLRVYEQFIPKRFFTHFKEILFHDIQFYVPVLPEKFLCYAYGKDWKKPQKGKSGRVAPKWMVIERLIYKINRKMRYIRFKNFDYDDPDFY